MTGIDGSMKKILVFLPTYPDAPPLQTLEATGFLAHFLATKLTAFVPQLSGDKTSRPLVVGAFPLNFPRLMNEAVHISERNAASLAEGITNITTEYGITLDLRHSLTTLFSPSQPLVDLARLHDLLVLPLPETDSFDRDFVQPALFDTGRPTLLLPSGEENMPLDRLDTVVVAWDFSRQSARALADALPILIRAKKVHLLTVFGEKGIQTTCASGDLEQYLAAHGVKHTLEERTLNGASISKTITSCAQEMSADLLVMGAYGHSRFREFVLGGATRGILSNPRLPIFLSH